MAAVAICSDFGAPKIKSDTVSTVEARGGSWEEPPTPKARAGGREEQPKEQWLRGRRRA